MGNKVIFRDFELRDIDFIYKAKNDHRVNDTIVGDYSNFSYEDAIQWVKGCMKKDDSYKYWAICTDDVFQNIVGWCGLSNIDYKNRMAYLCSINIYDHKYKDTVTWYETNQFIADYVFNVLNFNRMYATCIEANVFQYQFLKLLPNMLEGTMRKAMCKNGKYYDVAIFGLLKEEYEEYKRKGLFEFSSIQTFLKNNVRRSNNTFSCIEDFIIQFVKELDTTDPDTITPETKFRDLEEWSSLLAVNMVAIAEGGFHTNFDMNELSKCDTIKDLYDMVKRLSAKN